VIDPGIGGVDWLEMPVLKFASWRLGGASVHSTSARKGERGRRTSENVIMDSGGGTIPTVQASL
jgi:hypothetical protein